MLSSRTKDTKKEYYEKYTQGQKLKTLDGGEVFFQANKTYAHIINQAQEEAANCKRPGPNWKEVRDMHKYLNVRYYNMYCTSFFRSNKSWKASMDWAHR